MMKAARNFRKTLAGGIVQKNLFSYHLFDLVTNKSTYDEDDEKEKYLYEEAGRSQGSEVDTLAPGDNILRSEHKDDPENQADNNAIFKEEVIVFLSLVEKAKGDTQNQVQYFQKHSSSPV